MRSIKLARVDSAIRAGCMEIRGCPLSDGSPKSSNRIKLRGVPCRSVPGRRRRVRRSSTVAPGAALGSVAGLFAASSVPSGRSTSELDPLVRRITRIHPLRPWDRRTVAAFDDKLPSTIRLGLSRLVASQAARSVVFRARKSGIASKDREREGPNSRKKRQKSLDRPDARANGRNSLTGDESPGDTDATRQRVDRSSPTKFTRWRFELVGFDLRSAGSMG